MPHSNQLRGQLRVERFAAWVLQVIAERAEWTLLAEQPTGAGWRL
jgi:hypothetical protein